MAEAKDKKDTPPLNLHQRLHAVMGDVSYIQKDRNVGNYKVVSHDAVTAKVRPVLVKHGVIYYPQNMVHEQNGNRTEVHLDIVFVNVDEPADRIAVPSFGYGIDASDKGPGKAVSYAVKMALLKALGLETGEDADDGTNVEHKPEPAPAKSAPGISEARTWVREHIRELENSEDGAHFMTTVAALTPRWAKVCGVYPALWQGPDGGGLLGEGKRLSTIFQCRAEFDAFVKQIEATARDFQQPAQATQ